ncbi:hypothetical protein [Kitasatospora sp. NPDC050463]|uniref:hypothetical protein n=1 Tax=Kitasatospora sp. NPDC050463 TaxID=3155786 RepID=UPI0033DB6779
MDRESFTIGTVDPQTGSSNGAIRAEDFAHQILRTLGLCGKLLTGTALPAGPWRGERAATDILALARKGRAHRSVQKLVVKHGGHYVTDGAALALAATVITWAERTGTPATDVAEDTIG